MVETQPSPRLTVVIPALDAARQIEETLASLSEGHGLIAEVPLGRNWSFVRAHH